MRNFQKDRWRDALTAVRPAFVVVGLFSLFVNLTMLVAPVYMMQVYDRVLASKSHDTLLMLTALAAVLLALGAVVDAARSRLLVRISADLDNKLKRVLFHGAFLERKDAAKPESPEAASQPLRDFDKVRSFVTGAGVLAFFDAPWIPIYLAIIFMFHPLLGAIALAGAICIFLLALISEYSTRTPLTNAGVQMRSSRDFVDAFARNSESVRAMGMLPSLEQRWLDHHEAGVAWQAHASDRMASIQAVTKALRAALQIAILGTGAWLALEQLMSAGVMVAASIIMGRALAPVEAGIGQWRSFIEARSALSRLKFLLKDLELPEERSKTLLPEPKGHLSVENVGLKFAGVDTPVLRGVSLELEPGEMLGLIGPSGAGKSSLARMICGAGLPSVGTVRFDGADISEWPDENLGPSVGYLPQNVELFQGTVGENIARFGPHNSQEIVAAAKLASAHEMILTLAQGYDTPIEIEGRNLSGGQRQRIGLARAVYGKARIIVLDEPNANLDAEGEFALKTTLSRLKSEGRTVITISHKPSLLTDVDKLLVLRDGMVDLFGPREEVLPDLFRAVESHNEKPSRVTQRSSDAPQSNGGLHATR
ncbi:MAG: type I secretion system permease/ATPase [Hyphomicrobiaceae bacterium]